jgi:hypothetical protein
VLSSLKTGFKQVDKVAIFHHIWGEL